MQNVSPIKAAVGLAVEIKDDFKVGFVSYGSTSKASDTILAQLRENKLPIYFLNASKWHQIFKARRKIEGIIASNQTKIWMKDV